VNCCLTEMSLNDFWKRLSRVMLKGGGGDKYYVG
jgi:hypothetical protein